MFDQGNAGDEASLDRTVKTSAASPELESQYIDQELKEKYKLLAYIGSGGGGIIYKVADKSTGEEVVLKLIKHDLSDQAKQRFEIEAQACSLISHPNVVRIIEYGVTQSGVHYIVMPYCKGTSLRSLLQRGTTDTSLMVDVFQQICDGLGACHRAGIVHRDMKPENVLVDTVGSGYVVHIIDFGIAKVVPAGGEIQALTQTGEVFGTPAYMSPEQCTGRRVDFRTDIYSIGCMLFEAFVGHAPYRAENAFLTLSQHIDGPLPRVPRIDVLEDIADKLEKVVHRCMAKDPDDRFQSILDLSRELPSLQTGKSVVDKLKASIISPRFAVTTLILLVVLAAAGTWQVMEWRKQSEVEKRTSDTDRILATLEKAVIAINKGDSKAALQLTNRVIKRLEADGLVKENSDEVSTGISYSAAYREALYLRAHAELLDPSLISQAQADFQRCSNMHNNDPSYEASLAYSHLKQNEFGAAKQGLHKLRPTLAGLRARFNNEKGFSDGWNTPDIIERIKAAKQEIVFQDIVRVDSRQRTWADVGDVEIKPDYRLWIDCKDDCMWSIGVRDTDKLPTWSDADGRSTRKLHEENIMCLLGMVGDNHSFFVGRHLWDAIAPGTGRLHLICNDGPQALGAMPLKGFEPKFVPDNRGTMVVRVFVTKPLNSDNLTGWKTPNIFKLIEDAKQKVVAQTIVRVDSRSKDWKLLDGITVRPSDRIWFDCKADERCDFMCPQDAVSTNNSVMDAAGRKGSLVHGFNVGSLIGRIGDHVFFVGTSALNMVPPATGDVRLIFNDGREQEKDIPLTGGDAEVYTDNKGAFTVRVVVTEPRTP